MALSVDPDQTEPEPRASATAGGRDPESRSDRICALRLIVGAAPAYHERWLFDLAEPKLAARINPRFRAGPFENVADQILHSPLIRARLGPDHHRVIVCVIQMRAAWVKAIVPRIQI